MAKRPTKVELVDLICHIGIVELFHECWCFLNADQTMMQPEVFQDWTSVITQNGGVTHTMHMKVRMHLSKESMTKYHCRI
jgi:hypothetical protein